MDTLSNIILLCGYRTTGKDTFFQILTKNPGFHTFRYKIFAHPNFKSSAFNTNLPYERLSFADNLKQEASIEYGIPAHIPDSDKDLKQFIHPTTKSLISARDIYIEWADIRKSQDQDYWIKKAFDSHKIGSSFIVTDWRYTNESFYVKQTFQNTITARIYRSNIIEPALSISSEHSLDFYQTDLLILSHDLEDDFEKAVQRFPQYKDFILHSTI